MTDAIAPLRRRLERFEIEHLRAHCNELAGRIELLKDENATLRAEISRAWEMAEAWNEQVFVLHQLIISEADLQIGMTKGGEIGVVE